MSTAVPVATFKGLEADRLSVALDDRSYDIHIGSGLLANSAALLEPVLEQRRVIIVTDENVAPLYLATLEESLAAANIKYDSIVVPAGEHTKNMDQLSGLLDDFLRLGIERRTTIIALGGGVIGDLTGFAASIALRGIPFVQIPTTLLAQVDSSVGGKTAINSPRGKNLIGAFYQPRLVLADIDTLSSLPHREVMAGYAEVVKYGLINDPEFFAWLEDHADELAAGDKDALRYAVTKSCAAKADVVAQDERENGVRALLNLGHTFGHAFETEAGYGDTLLHGEAVALGIGMAFNLSVDLGLCPAADRDRVYAHFDAVGLPVQPPQRNWDTDILLGHMASDKKVKDGNITFILARGIGGAFIANDVILNDVRRIVDAAIAA
ncbi:MAG: 3-dehydroquinate synthase [Proteobacteria bacterium]|nr:3-dehydroquinate synthase [Pseudomonadota bacterium]